MKEEENNSGWMYMLRTTQQHHVQLSFMADQKANILITCNSIILSLSLARLDVIQQYWSTYTLFAASASSMILALLVVTPFSASKETIDSKEDNFNFLFFGHFTNVSFHRFKDKMNETMESSSQVKDAMLRDIYQVGMALKTRKYRFLKWSSAVFMLGVISSMMVLVVQIMTA